MITNNKKSIMEERRKNNPVKHLWWSFFATSVTVSLSLTIS